MMVIQSVVELISPISIFDAISVATLLVSGYIAYRSKANSLRSARDQEQFLNNRLKESTYVEEPFVVNIDHIEVREREGLKYRIKRSLFLPLEASTTIRVRWQYSSLTEDWWESEITKILAQQVDTQFQHLSTEIVADQAVSVFRLETTDSDEIGDFVAMLPGFAKAVTEGFEGTKLQAHTSQFTAN